MEIRGISNLDDYPDRMLHTLAVISMLSHATVDVNPESDNYGQVGHSPPVGGRNEAHHSGLTDGRRYLWASGLDTSKIFIFDIHTDPAQPRRVFASELLRE